MRRPCLKTYCWTDVGRSSFCRALCSLGFLLIFPLQGCTVSDGELLLNDVKTYYLNGELSDVMNVDVDASLQEEEDFESEMLEGVDPRVENEFQNKSDIQADEWPSGRAPYESDDWDEDVWSPDEASDAEEGWTTQGDFDYIIETYPEEEELRETELDD